MEFKGDSIFSPKSKRNLIITASLSVALGMGVAPAVAFADDGPVFAGDSSVSGVETTQEYTAPSYEDRGSSSGYSDTSTGSTYDSNYASGGTSSSTDTSKSESSSSEETRSSEGSATFTSTGSGSDQESSSSETQKSTDDTDKGQQVTAGTTQDGASDASGEGAASTDQNGPEAGAEEGEINTLDDAAADVEKKQAAFDKASEDLTKAEDDLQGVEDEINAELDEALGDYEKDLKKAKSAYDSASSKSAAAKEEFDSASQELDDATSASAAASERQSEAKAKADEAIAGTEYESIGEAAEATRGEANELKGKLDDYQKATGGAAIDGTWVDSALDTYDKAESSVESASAYVEKKESAYAAAKQAVSSLVSGNSYLSAEFKDLAKKLDRFIAADDASDKALREAIDSTSGAQSSGQGREKAHEGASSSPWEEKAAAKSAKAELDRAIDALQASCGRFWIDTWRSCDVSHATSNLFAAVGDLVHAQHALNSAEITRDDALQAVAQFADYAPEGEYASEEERIAAGIAEALKLSDEIASTTEQYNAKDSEAKTLEGLRDELNEANEALEAAQKRVETAKERRDAAEKNYNQLASEAGQAKSNFDEASEAYDKKYNEVAPGIRDKYSDRFNAAKQAYDAARAAYDDASDALSQSQATYRRLWQESQRQSRSDDDYNYEREYTRIEAESSYDDYDSDTTYSSVSTTETTTSTTSTTSDQGEVQLVENTVSSLTNFEVDREAAEDVKVVSEPVLNKLDEGVYEVEKMPGVDLDWLVENAGDETITQASDIENYWWYIYIDGEVVRIMDANGVLAPGIERVIWAPNGKLGAVTFSGDIVFAQAGGMTVVITATSVRGIDIVKAASSQSVGDVVNNGPDSILAVEKYPGDSVVSDGTVVPNVSLGGRVASYIPLKVPEVTVTPVTPTAADVLPLSVTADVTDSHAYVAWGVAGVSALLVASIRRRHENGARRR